MKHLRLVKFYHRHMDDLGRMWFVPYDTKFPADDVWVWSPERQPGANDKTRTFTLSPGSSVETRGAALRDASALLEYTGVDVTGRHAIKMTVCRTPGSTLLYKDHDWVASSVEASRANAQHISNHNGVKVVARIETVDGDFNFILSPETPTEDLGPVA